MLKNKLDQEGFTIVELLVVIVVIAILAAITLVSYTGISSQAAISTAQANADSIQSAGEAYNAEFGYYPDQTTDFTAATYSRLAAGLTISFTTNPTSPVSGNGKTNFRYQYCGAVAAPAASAVTGGRIAWHNNTAIQYSYVGTGSAAGGAGAAPCHTWVDPTS